MRCTRIALAVAIVAIGPAVSASAGNVTVGAGSALDLGTGSLALGCADLEVSGSFSAGSVGVTAGRDITIHPTGTLNGDSALLSLTGNWNNAGTFNAGTSTVQMADGCALSSGVVSGDNSFANLSISTTTARQVSFTAGSTQAITGGLTLLGSAGNRLKVRSTVNGNAAFFNASGTSIVSFVDVQDNDSQGGNAIPVPPNSLKGPNTPGWLDDIAAPLLAPLGLALLALLLLVSGQRWLPRTSREDDTP